MKNIRYARVGKPQDIATDIKVYFELGAECMSVRIARSASHTSGWASCDIIERHLAPRGQVFDLEGLIAVDYAPQNFLVNPELCPVLRQGGVQPVTLPVGSNGELFLLGVRGVFAEHLASPRGPV